MWVSSSASLSTVRLVPLHAPRQLEGDVVVRAEAHEAHVAAGAALPAVQLLAHEEDRLPERATGARGAAALDLDHRRGHLDHAGVEVHRAAGRQVVRGALPVHQRLAHEGCGLPKTASGALAAVDPDLELRLHPDRGQLQPVSAPAVLALFCALLIGCCLPSRSGGPASCSSAGPSPRVAGHHGDEAQVQVQVVVGARRCRWPKGRRPDPRQQPAGERP
jgi:hypothetical protein